MKAYEDQGVEKNCLDMIKTYYQGYLQQRKHSINCLMGARDVSELARKVVHRMETIYLVGPKIRDIIFIKRVQLWEPDRPNQQVMVVLRRTTPIQPKQTEEKKIDKQKSPIKPKPDCLESLLEES